MSFDELLSTLAGIRDDVDFEAETSLIDGGVLDSFDILAIISAIDEDFDLQIPAKDIVPANFNSAQSLFELLQRLEDEA